MTASNFDLILEEWTASLKKRDRKAEAVEGNFEDFFATLKSANATFDEARELLPKAIKAHLPPIAVVKNTYRMLKQSHKISDQTEKEWADGWNKDISDMATNAFYTIFPRPKAKDEEDGEPKIYGGGKISAKEYKLQRHHANTFESIDLSTLDSQENELLTEEELLEIVRKNTNE